MSYRWKPDYLSRKVADLQKTLSSLTDSTIADLVRRGQESSDPDGYGSGAGDGLGVNGGGGQSTTEAAALSGLPNPDPDASGNAAAKDDWENRKREHDVILEALDELFTCLVEMSGLAKIIEKKRVVILNAGDKLRDRGFTQCHGCHRDVMCTTADPIRAGYCDACRKAFERWNKTFPNGDVAVSRWFFDEQRTRFEGHNAASCEMCVYEIERRKHAHAV